MPTATSRTSKITTKHAALRNVTSIRSSRTMAPAKVAPKAKVPAKVASKSVAPKAKPVAPKAKPVAKITTKASARTVVASAVSRRCELDRHDECAGRNCACNCGHKSAARGGVQAAAQAHRAAVAAGKLPRKTRTPRAERAASPKAGAAPKRAADTATSRPAAKRAPREGSAADRTVARVRDILADGQGHSIAQLMQAANVKTGAITSALRTLGAVRDGAVWISSSAATARKASPASA